MSHVKTASVIIPTYNRLDLLSQTLRSLANSSTPLRDLDVIVVDDGSSDGTFDAVRDFVDQFDIKYIFQPDKGFRLAKAKNLGISASDGDICILIDSGIVVPSWFISAHLDANSLNGPSFVVGNILGFDYNDKNTEMLTTEMHGKDIDYLVREWEGRKELLDPREAAWVQCGDDLMQLPAPWALAWGCNISVHRDLLKLGVRFDEHYQSWGAEDQDFALGLYNQGVNFELSRTATGVHVPHPKSESNNDASVLKNKKYLHEKYNMRETELLIEMRAVPLNAYLASYPGMKA